MQLWQYSLIVSAILLAIIKLFKLCQYGPRRREDGPSARNSTNSQELPIYTLDDFDVIENNSGVSNTTSEQENGSRPPPYVTLINLGAPPPYEPPPDYSEIIKVNMESQQEHPPPTEMFI